ncbi:hypothetical protein E2553_38100 [Paraburkholderia dipogonis]|uniref:Uncharacterized protein n=1 Tax=Paraburkholderia dipogonis TaxID=1211383 RepID=A0A4Y8MIQ7_9BURK|nr:hypothetical protein [Paraburkholderia dipogonis]TFE37315.1 hypothetical protein E2553_38100 [Paraburkholderia dipogonis]
MVREVPNSDSADDQSIYEWFALAFRVENTVTPLLTARIPPAALVELQAAVVRHTNRKGAVKFSTIGVVVQPGIGTPCSSPAFCAVMQPGDDRQFGTDAHQKNLSAEAFLVVAGTYQLTEADEKESLDAQFALFDDNRLPEGCLTIPQLSFGSMSIEYAGALPDVLIQCTTDLEADGGMEDLKDQLETAAAGDRVRLVNVPPRGPVVNDSYAIQERKSRTPLNSVAEGSRRKTIPSVMSGVFKISSRAT